MLIIPANRPRVTATSEGVIVGFILITELTTVLTSNDTVAMYLKCQYLYLFFLRNEGECFLHIGPILMSLDVPKKQ